MKQFLNRRNLSFFLLTFIVSTLVNGGPRLLNVWLSPTESVLRTPIFAITFLQQGLFIVLIIQAIAQASTQNGRQSTTLLMLFGGIYALTGFFSIRLANAMSPPIKLRGYEAFVDENSFLIAAIEQYTVDQGHPPDRLEQLYPQYLSPPIATLDASDESGLHLAVPYQSIDAKSAEQVAYQYTFPAELENNEQEQWAVSIAIQLGSFSWVKFVHTQTQVYDADYTQIGEWGYQERLNNR
ncbi:MAG: hypothetical protein ACPG8W_06430 [Candidatus Promineifilaceae bacterium]